MGNYLLVLISVGLAIGGQFMMKQGMNLMGKFPISELGIKLIPMLFNPFVFGGLALFAVSSIFWLVVLSRLDLSLVYPMVSFGYVLVVFLSWIIFKENVTWVRWLGVSIICFGVILISRS